MKVEFFFISFCQLQLHKKFGEMNKERNHAENFQLELVNLVQLADSAITHQLNWQRLGKKVNIFLFLRQSVSILKFTLLRIINNNWFGSPAEFERQQQMTRQEPKIYSKSMIHYFMEKRKLAKQQSEQRFLQDFFNYPDELLRLQSELPPSLRLIDPEKLKEDFKLNFFG